MVKYSLICIGSVLVGEKTWLYPTSGPTKLIAVKCSAGKCAIRVATSGMCIYKAITHTARCGHPVTIRSGQSSLVELFGRLCDWCSSCLGGWVFGALAVWEVGCLVI